MEHSPLLPCPGYVLLEAIESTSTPNHFVLSESSKNPGSSRKGRVLAVGDTQTTEYGAVLNAPCKVGDIVRHRQWTEDGFEYEGKNLKFTNFKDIALIYPKE